MNDKPTESPGIPSEIDFGKGLRGLHHVPAGAKIFLPVSIEKSVWEYFSGKAEGRGMNLSELLSEVLRRDIEIQEALDRKSGT
jgi:hypothetical protein